MSGRYPNGRGSYAQKRANEEHNIYLKSLEVRIDQSEKKITALESAVEILLKDKNGSVENEVVKATATNTATAKKLIDFKKAELKALAEEAGINDTDFKNKEDYVKALKEKDPTLE